MAAINRADPKRPYCLLEPGKQSRVCSRHFVDGCPTTDHPDPELFLGEKNLTKQRKVRIGHVIRATPASSELLPSEPTPASSDSAAEPPSTTAAIFACLFLLCSLSILYVYARMLWDKCCSLSAENTRLLRSLHIAEAKIAKLQKCESGPISLLKNDNDTRFYTGIETKNAFQALHEFCKKFIRRRWRGFSYTRTARRRRLFCSPQKFGPKPKLTSEGEFLMTLMKLRLGLLNKDLADRFRISISQCSKTIKTWLSAMSKTLGKLVFWPTKEQVMATKPQRFRNLPDIRAIIDCTEIFIETPKDPFLQSVTWSDYKHHNTLKFLVAIAPNSCITFLSKCYCGRATDKAVTLDSKFLDHCDRYDMIQADKGFNITADCDARLISLDVPPGKRGVAQLSVAACNKTKRIANQRILVEQVIRRLKTFRILQTELPISLVPCVDDIVNVCASLTNLRKPICCT